MKRCIFLCLLGLLSAMELSAQNDHPNRVKDTALIQEYEDGKEPDKVLHAEPLYIDLIRDLGARKGEKEWNVGLGLFDNLDFDRYEMLVEYEWAPVNRLGLEVEVPFTFYSAQRGIDRDSVPSNQMDALQFALQWSFLVSEDLATSMALGYLNELEFSDFRHFGNPLFKGNVYNPFFIAAKRFGRNIHSLVYTGPAIEQSFEDKAVDFAWELNANLHYMVPGTENFVGLEANMEWETGNYSLTLRPQLRLDISETIRLGLVAGIPVRERNERFSAFVRLIWEPE